MRAYLLETLHGPRGPKITSLLMNSLGVGCVCFENWPPTYQTNIPKPVVVVAVMTSPPPDKSPSTQASMHAKPLDCNIDRRQLLPFGKCCWQEEARLYGAATPPRASLAPLRLWSVGRPPGRPASLRVALSRPPVIVQPLGCQEPVPSDGFPIFALKLLPSKPLVRNPRWIYWVGQDGRAAPQCNPRGQQPSTATDSQTASKQQCLDAPSSHILSHPKIALDVGGLRRSRISAAGPIASWTNRSVRVLLSVYAFHARRLSGTCRCQTSGRLLK
ncbi:hypothetical protein LX36DRAFT_269739 [Colletotrichum falcatum]|nr:hypothetical protein LX36DRAFT_269739 [Colletotrichum falcatum]